MGDELIILALAGFGLGDKYRICLGICPGSWRHEPEQNIIYLNFLKTHHGNIAHDQGELIFAHAEFIDFL